MIYFIVMLLSLLIYELSNNNKMLVLHKPDTKRKADFISISLLLSMLPYLLCSTLRFEIGDDYVVYTTIYYQYGAFGTKRGWEILFELITVVARFLRMPHFIIVVLAILFCWYTFRWIFEQSENIGLSIALLFFTGTYIFSLLAMRQAAATVLFLYATKYLEEGKTVKTAFLILIFSLLHKTALVYLAAVCIFYGTYFLIKRHRAGTVKIVYFGILVFSQALMPSFRSGIEWFASWTGFYSKVFHSKYDSGNISGSLLLYVVPVFLLATFTSAEESNESYDMTGNKMPAEHSRKKYWIYYTFQWCAAMAAVFLPIIPNGERIVYLFFPITICSCPYFINRLKISGIKQKKAIKYMIGILLLMCFCTATVSFFFIGNEKIDYLLPYKTIFRKWMNI